MPVAMGDEREGIMGKSGTGVSRVQVWPLVSGKLLGCQLEGVVPVVRDLVREQLGSSQPLPTLIKSGIKRKKNHL